MARFIAFFLIPPDVIDGWKTTDEATRKPAEQKMMADWQAWTQAHAAALSGMDVGGRTKRVTREGASDTRNAITLYCFVEAASHEDAVQMFADHPHLTIPQSSIEIMEVRPMTGG